MQRIFLTGLALVPAIAAALPLSGFSVAMSGLGSAYALVASLRPQPDRVNRTSGRSRSDTLLRGPLPKAERAKLPNPSAISQELLRALACSQEFHIPGAPLDRDTAIMRTLQGFMQGWKTLDLAKLSAAQRTELYLINTLLRADPGEAGRVAQLFARPDTMLDLRDEIDLITLRRAAFDRDYGAFLSTQAIWEQNRAAGPLLRVLKSLPEADVDLWHHVVMEHDLFDADQQAAALWCLEQPSCDRATVAGYFGRLTRDQTLRDPRAQSDPEFLHRVRQLIQGWNDGTYKHQELALDPPHRVATLQPFFDAELDFLTEQLGQAWPAPHCIFVNFEGRAPRDRSIWDLLTGTLTAPPRQGDYFEPAFSGL